MEDTLLHNARRLAAAVLAAGLAWVGPTWVDSDALAPETPAAVVVVDANAVVPKSSPLPRSWWARSRVPRSQIHSVAVLTADQARVLSTDGELAVVRSPPSMVDRARIVAATDWAIRENALHWHPKRWVLVLLAAATALTMGAAPWSRRLMVIGVGVLVTFGLAGLRVWLPIGLLPCLVVAWTLSDVAYVVGMFSWAEWRIRSTPVRRPASQPTPLPVSSR